MNSLLHSNSIKRNFLSFIYKERYYKVPESDTELMNSPEIQDKLCYYIPHGKHLIKRANHSVIEIQNYMFYIGGEQSRKCEMLDLRDNNFHFIEELNSLHISPILYLKGKKIYSLNFESIKKHYKEYLMQDKNFVYESIKNTFRKNDLTRNSTSEFFELQVKELKISAVEEVVDNIKLKTLASYNQLNYTKTKFIFCESYDTSELTSNPKWHIERIKFNLGESFSFSNFIYFKYLTIREEMIYIVGSDKIFDPLDSEFRLYGLCFNIINQEFTPLDKRTILKLDPLKTALAMGSNIIDYKNNFYYLNCFSNKVEILPFDSLFS